MNTKLSHYFPQCTHDPTLIYLDTAATSLTPTNVLVSMERYYTQYRSNVSRGIYSNAETATKVYEAVREKCRALIGAQDVQEIIFTAGTTHSINMISSSISTLTDDINRAHGPHIVVTAMDHHANFVPWQHVITHYPEGTFSVIDLSDDYTLNLTHLTEILTEKTTILALPYISNVLGTINPVREIIAIARDINPDIIIVVDAAQAAAHVPIDVLQLDCDFLAFSGHKIYGPTGTGILWGKRKHLEKVEPFLFGGEMIAEVTHEQTIYKDLPQRLEAGTPNIAGVIGMGSAIDFIQSIGFSTITDHEKELTKYALEQLKLIDDLTIYGPQDEKIRTGVISFTVDNMHPHDIASILSTEKNIALRAGNHCAMPLHIQHMDVPATARISIGLHNTREDIDHLVDGLEIARKILCKPSKGQKV